MLESLAAMILQKSLGWLVDGLDSKNFDVSLWSGEVILHNLAKATHWMDYARSSNQSSTWSITRVHCV